MKARDVVAGWPRGRSTAAGKPWLHIRWWMRIRTPYDILHCCMVLDDDGSVIHDPEKRQGYIERTRADMIKCLRDHDESVAYHASQQRMVDEYRCGCSTIGYLARETQSGILVVIPNELIGIAYAVEPNSSAGVFVNLSRGVVR